MLTPEEKRFFADTARGAANLSRCDKPTGAVLVKNRKILSYGFGRKVIKGREWEVSAIADALFGSREIDISGSTLFSNTFPSLDDLKMIISLGIDTVYFLGNPDLSNNTDTVLFANALAENSIPLELVKLE